jgi:hypothetical protein
VRGLGLEQRLADVAVVARVGLALGQRLGHQHVDGDAVLGVHHEQAAVLGALLHRAQDLAVVAVEDPGVGHEHLEAGHALVDELVHLLERRVVDVGEDHVERVVDRAVALGLGVPGVEPLAQRLADRLDREVDDRGRPAPRRRPRAGLEGVRGLGAAERHLHVGVRVHAARDHVQPGRVDHRVGVLGPALRDAAAGGGDGRHRLAVDQHVGAQLVGRRDDQAVLDQGPCRHDAVQPSTSGP